MAGITVVVLTDAGGSTLGSFLAVLAKSGEVDAVVVADPGGACEAAARTLI